MKELKTNIGLSGPDLPALVRAVAGRFLPKTLPSRVYADAAVQKVQAGWLAAHLVGARQRSFAKWDTGDWKLLLVHAPVVMLEGRYPADPSRLASELATLPFFAASFGSLFSDWKVEGAEYAAPILGSLHYPHGWACAFKGEGHGQLVSRRWLDFGPWRLLRAASDVSLVQFHDLEADESTALAQARPGHERMGPGPQGSYIRSDHVRTHDLNGLYEPKDQILRIVVTGRDVSQAEMLDACALRMKGAVGPGQPLKRVAYVLMEAERAKAHLHELWLRELECWTIAGGKEVRLDVDYRPTPVKPDWVKALEARST